MTLKMAPFLVSVSESQWSSMHRAFFMLDILTCHSRESTGLTNKMNDWPKVVYMLAHCHTVTAYWDFSMYISMTSPNFCLYLMLNSYSILHINVYIKMQYPYSYILFCCLYRLQDINLTVSYTNRK